jgi:hypothetical protein
MQRRVGRELPIGALEWIHFPTFVGSFCLSAYGLRYLRWHNIHKRLSVLEHKGIQKNQ